MEQYMPLSNLSHRTDGSKEVSIPIDGKREGKTDH